MKIFLPILCLASLVLAEPPVSDGYPAARSSNYHNNDDHQETHLSEHQRSLSQEYGPPSFASSRNALSAEYDVSNAKSALNPRGQSRKSSPPAARVSFNQRFRSPALRSSNNNDLVTKSLSQEYGVPNTRSETSQEYGVPSARSPSQKYGVPSLSSSTRSLSTEYGLPESRSAPSQEYGVPAAASARRNQNPYSQSSSFGSAQTRKTSPQDYSALSTRAQFPTYPVSPGYNGLSARTNDVSQGYDTPNQFARSSFAARSLSQTHSPKSAPISTYSIPSSRSLSSSYDIPSSRNTDSTSQDFNSVSSYDVPSQRDTSDAFEGSSSRGLSQAYGVPSSRANLKSSAISYSAARSSLSSTYLPTARAAMPSEQYGVPEQRESQEYDYARARALEELINQEPASYDFAYQIEDVESGSDFGHTETREENRAEGSYFVVLPDGTKQTVEYEADERGYKPRISVEPVAIGVGGYDDNAAGISSAEDGPY